MRRKRFAALMFVCMFLLNMASCAEVPDISVTETSAVVTTQEATIATTAEESTTQETTAPHTTLPVTTTEKVTVPTTVEKTTKATTTEKVTEKTTTTTTAKVTTTKVTEPEPQSGTCYWVASGKVYHLSSDCATLKRSKKIYSGTVNEAVALGKKRPCKVCS